MSGPRPEARQVRTQLACRGSAVRSIAWFDSSEFLNDSAIFKPSPVARSVIFPTLQNKSFVLSHYSTKTIPTPEGSATLPYHLPLRPEPNSQCQRIVQPEATKPTCPDLRENIHCFRLHLTHQSFRILQSNDRNHRFGSRGAPGAHAAGVPREPDTVDCGVPPPPTPPGFAPLPNSPDFIASSPYSQVPESPGLPGRIASL